MDAVKKRVAVLSGKGGVGKSTVAVNLALCLASRGLRVGVLDVDLTGPSVPSLLGVGGEEVHQSSSGWVPVYAQRERQNVAVMSVAFLLPTRDAAVVWRGPKKNATIAQFVSNVVWGDLDVLVIDTPPGTSDEHLATIEYVRPDTAVLVTTPQAVALDDVRREISFCRKQALPIAGLVENMSGFVCPHCAECTNVFSTGGGESLAAQQHIPFLARIPIDPARAQRTPSADTPPDEQLFAGLYAFADLTKLELYPQSTAADADADATATATTADADAAASETTTSTTTD